MKFLVYLALLMPLVLFSQTGEEIARLVDNRPEPLDMTSDMTMILTNKKGKTRTMTVHSVLFVIFSVKLS